MKQPSPATRLVWDDKSKTSDSDPRLDFLLKEIGYCRPECGITNARTNEVICYAGRTLTKTLLRKALRLGCENLIFPIPKNPLDTRHLTLCKVQALTPTANIKRAFHHAATLQ